MSQSDGLDAAQRGGPEADFQLGALGQLLTLFDHRRRFCICNNNALVPETPVSRN